MLRDDLSAVFVYGRGVREHLQGTGDLTLLLGLLGCFPLVSEHVI